MISISISPKEEQKEKPCLKVLSIIHPFFPLLPNGCCLGSRSKGELGGM